MLCNLVNMCRNGINVSSGENQFDTPQFTEDALPHSAKGYRKISKGSDHWLATELRIDPKALRPIADALDHACCALAWPHQMLLNLNPELAKASGGTRATTKTFTLYRLWARTRKRAMDKSEST